MGLFSEVEKADITSGGVYFLPGKYRVRVDGVKTVRSSRNRKDYFVIECEILASDNDERKVGTHASQVIDISQIMGPVNIKAFVAAASGIDHNDVDDLNAALVEKWYELTDQEMTIEQICETVVDEDVQPLVGIELDLECHTITTRAERKPFTKHVWTPVAV